MVAHPCKRTCRLHSSLLSSRPRITSKHQMGTIISPNSRWAVDDRNDRQLIDLARKVLRGRYNAESSRHHCCLRSYLGDVRFPCCRGDGVRRTVWRFQVSLVNRFVSRQRIRHHPGSFISSCVGVLPKGYIVLVAVLVDCTRSKQHIRAVT